VVPRRPGNHISEKLTQRKPLFVQILENTERMDGRETEGDDEGGRADRPHKPYHV
jgi:hypothetical protein